jgi:hypothetical protein
VFKGLQIVELDECRRWVFEMMSPEVDEGLSTQKQELPFNGFTVESEQIGTASLRDAGGEELEEFKIELSFLLFIAGFKGGRGEALQAESAEEALDPLFITPAAIGSDPDGVSPLFGAGAKGEAMRAVSCHASALKAKHSPYSF